METRTIVLAEVVKKQRLAAYAEQVAGKIAEMVQNNRLPKIVALMHQMYPVLAGDRIASAIRVLKVTQDTQELEETVQGGTPQERLVRYGSRWELPCWIAKAIIYDLRKGIDLDNPSREDLRESAVFRVAETYQCPRETGEAFINALPGIPEKRDEEDIIVPSQEKAIERLHPLVKERWEKNGKRSYGLEPYEILSETLKAYPDKESWMADSWKQREEKVPELLAYNIHCRLDLENDLLKLYNN